MELATLYRCFSVIVVGGLFVVLVVWLLTLSPDARPSDESIADVDDDDIAQPEVLGELDPTKKYAVFWSMTSGLGGASTSLLPVTVAAWRRVGFESVVVLFGSMDVWNSDRRLHDTLTTIRRSSAVVVFLKTQPARGDILGQMSEVFSMLVRRPRSHVGNPDDVTRAIYIATADVDVWPIGRDALYGPTKFDEILSTSSLCCELSVHRRALYRTLPTAGDVIDIRLWNKSLTRVATSRQNAAADDISMIDVRVTADGHKSAVRDRALMRLIQLLHADGTEMLRWTPTN